MYLTLKLFNKRVVKWWVVADFSIHLYIKINTGSTISMFKGYVYSTFICQRFNTKSSTEANIVVLYNAIPMVL